MSKPRQRIPKLRFTAWRNLGWHVAYRDRRTGISRKHLFNIREREAEASVLYRAWIMEQLAGNGKGHPTQVQRPPRRLKRPEMLSTGAEFRASAIFTNT